MLDLTYINESLRPMATPLNDLRPDPRNARQHSDRNLATIKASLARYGQRKPIVVNRLTGVVEAGNGTLDAARALGWTHLAVVYVEDDAQTATGYALADNRTAELAEWNEDLLYELISELGEDFPVEEIGWTEEEWEELGPDTPSGGAGDNPPEDPNGELQKKWQTETGQVWQVGLQRVACGDSGDAALIDRLLAGDKIDMVFTSPPYGNLRDYDSGFTGWAAVMESVFGNLLPRMRKDGHVLVNLGLVHTKGVLDEYYRSLHEYNKSQGWPLYGQYVWDQGAGLPGQWACRLCPSFEFVFHYTQPSPRALFKTVECKTAGTVAKGKQRMPDGSQKPHTSSGEPVNSHKKPDSVIRVNRNTSQDTGADPAFFPVAFPEFVIPVFTKRGETVFEPFLGSGTTLVACERLGVKGRGCDLSPAYTAVSLERFALMGFTPRLDVTP